MHTDVHMYIRHGFREGL